MLGPNGSMKWESEGLKVAWCFFDGWGLFIEESPEIRNPQQALKFH